MAKKSNAIVTTQPLVIGDNDKAPAPVKLTQPEIEAVARFIQNAPCPGGIPQAQQHAMLLQRFLASVESKS